MAEILPPMAEIRISSMGGDRNTYQHINHIQSGASSRAKHGGAYFSPVRGSIKDPIAVPGQNEVQEC